PPAATPPASTATPTRGGGLPRTPNSNQPCRPSCTARSTPPISRCPSCHDKGGGARVDGGYYPCTREPLGNSVTSVPSPSAVAALVRSGVQPAARRRLRPCVRPGRLASPFSIGD